MDPSYRIFLKRWGSAYLPPWSVGPDGIDLKVNRLHYFSEYKRYPESENDIDKISNIVESLLNNLKCNDILKIQARPITEHMTVRDRRKLLHLPSIDPVLLQEKSTRRIFFEEITYNVYAWMEKNPREAILKIAKDENFPFLLFERGSELVIYPYDGGINFLGAKEDLDRIYKLFPKQSWSIGFNYRKSAQN